ncbi:MAG: efflux RND transporter periplasmic adaptor subunit [Pseudomonadota bacterium]|nr:efflux RND transporter periplasmic adaptor subunit [Pseudomonadota bacterium]
MNAYRRAPRVALPSALLSALLVAIGTTVGCAPPAAVATTPPPPANVGIVTIVRAPASLATELPGRVEASRVAEVRARAVGVVLERRFREGSDVKAGEVLFRIDPGPLQAAFASAEAALAKAEANQGLASLRAERYAPLVATRSISQQDYDDALAVQAQARADVAGAKAALTTSRLNLGYATVTAPIGGRIGRAEVTEGALVGQGVATLLATIQQLDVVYVNLAQSSSEVQRLRRSFASGALARAGDGPVQVTIVRDDGSEHPQPGTLLFTDVTVDATTGAVSLRAEVPNPDGALLPGEFVRARLAQAVIQDAITVPQQAVARKASGASVLVVGADELVAVRPIEVGDAIGDTWLVTKGLEAGDRVIVDGLQKARPGSPVTPVAWP